MAATYVPISIEEFEAYLNRAFRALRPRRSLYKSEYAFDLNLSKHVSIKILSSIHSSGQGAGVGSDAIRVQLFGKTTKRPLKSGKMPIVKRTQGWRDNLKSRVNEMAEEYEDRESYWNYLASGSRDERKKQELAKPEPPPPPPPPPFVPPEEEEEDDLDTLKGTMTGTFTKLRNGDWGVALDGTGGVSGAWVEVRKKSGGTVLKRLDSKVWTGRSRYINKRIEIWSISDDRSRRYASEDDIQSDEF